MMRLFWSFVHNCISHPLLFWTGDVRWAVVFHDWSNEHMKVRYPKVWKRIEGKKHHIGRFANETDAVTEFESENGGRRD